MREAERDGHPQASTIDSFERCRLVKEKGQLGFSAGIIYPE